MGQRRLIRDIILGIKTLMLHKLRSFLTMLGVVFGVGSVIAMLAVGEGASREALDQIRMLGSTNIIIRSVKPVEEEGQSQQRSMMSMYGLLYDDAHRIRQGFETVERIVPAKVVRREGRLGSRTLELRVVGTTAEWFELVPRAVLAGRHMNRDDYERRRAVCVLTEHGARRLMATENTVGRDVRIGGNIYEVIGIIQSEQGEAGGIATPDQQTDAYIPLNVARERYGDVDVRQSSGSREMERVELHQIIVQVDDTGNVEATADAIEAVLDRFHSRGDYHMSVPLALLRRAEATRRTFNIVLGSIAGISLLVGGIGIMNIMLASVTERTREIGIRRAIGAKRRQIIGQFLIETIVLTTIGGIVGIILGVTIPEIIERFAGMPTIVPFYGVALALGISMLVGIVFGLYPAMRAAGVDPIIALRHE